MSGVPCCALQVFARINSWREGRAGGQVGFSPFHLKAGPPGQPRHAGRDATQEGGVLVPTLTGAAFAASGGRLVCPLPMLPPPIESCSSPNVGDYNRNPRDDTAQLAPTISRMIAPMPATLRSALPGHLAQSVAW